MHGAQRLVGWGVPWRRRRGGMGARWPPHGRTAGAVAAGRVRTELCVRAFLLNSPIRVRRLGRMFHGFPKTKYLFFSKVSKFKASKYVNVATGERDRMQLAQKFPSRTFVLHAPPNHGSVLCSLCDRLLQRRILGSCNLFRGDLYKENSFASFRLVCLKISRKKTQP
jgi:hypothetical protein